jgi:hypothetical protein
MKKTVFSVLAEACSGILSTGSTPNFMLEFKLFAVPHRFYSRQKTQIQFSKNVEPIDSTMEEVPIEVELRLKKEAKRKRKFKPNTNTTRKKTKVHLTYLI